jgi:hypothetical protein
MRAAGEVYVQRLDVPRRGEALLLDPADACRDSALALPVSMGRVPPRLWALRTRKAGMSRYPLAEAIARTPRAQGSAGRAPGGLRRSIYPSADAAPPAQRPPLILP